MVNQKEYINSQEAWEQTNEGLFLGNSKSMVTSNVSLSYDNILYIKSPWVDPKFDFARMFNYRINKWNSLVGNYLDKEELIDLRETIDLREKKKSKGIYQETLKFTNNYKNGKDCLISLTFARRANYELPLLIFHTRALEATKRMLLDLLLVQRIGEYVFGEKKFSIIVYCPMVYLDPDTFTMYNNHRDIIKEIPSSTSNGKFQDKVLSQLKKFQKTPIDQISYKVNKRCARQLQFDKQGNPVGSGTKHLYAKDLKLSI